ncbi:MAG: hypothetical protein JWO22_3915 [Frankiales bacterium]|nr:hypothetical protein [Frankiales bacterium]
MTRVELLNTLPATLAHYEHALTAALGGSPEVRVVHAGIERSEGSFGRRLGAQLRARWALGRSDVPLVVLWPSFGLLEPLSWAWVVRHRPVLVVVHDPEPLRRQRGHGRFARALSGFGTRVVVVAHSRPAADVLVSQGYAPIVVPLPWLAPHAEPRRPEGAVLVLGQYKPSRSRAVLDELARDASLEGARQIWGRGWPPMTGWDVHDEFLPESRFVEVLSTARCLVLPYDRYFQSDVSLRALERGLPVVASRHPFLEDILGADWPGFVGADGWGAAVHRVVRVPEEEVFELAASAWQRAIEAWRSAVFGTGADRIER